jgi:BirA family transcriptional regulator, biotin operon repressor / biotin---[acetyl-CoA-carboxylase] ligase
MWLRHTVFKLPSPAGRQNDQAGLADLDQAGLRSAVLAPGALWSALDVVGETGSTNEDLLAAAGAGAAEGAVLVAERQTRGRGRQGRSWVTPPGAALTFSVLLRPAVPPAERGWLPLLAGVALARAVHDVTGVGVALKWPNDLLAALRLPSGGSAGGGPAGGGPAGDGPAGGGPPGEKLAGILAEQAGDAIVVGVGLNVGAGRDELPEPRPGALPPTSLALQGATAVDRGVLLAAVLRELERWYLRWTAAAADISAGVAADRSAAAGSGLSAEYQAWCSTIGREVRVELPGGAQLHGMATGLDQVGRLVVTSETGSLPVSAGDVIHLR